MQEQVTANRFIKRLLWQFCVRLRGIFHLKVFFFFFPEPVSGNFINGYQHS